MNDLFSNDTPSDPPIAGFFGAHRLLSNFWSVQVELDGVMYQSVENAYQAAKTSKHLRSAFTSCSAANAKALGRTVPMRSEWNAVKLGVMAHLIAQKFAQGTHMAQHLIGTGDRLLIESNTWGDTFWGQCGGKGHNHLGRLLMIQRDALRALDLTSKKTPGP